MVTLLALASVVAVAVVGVGRLIALKVYDEFMAVATSFVGASLLGIAIPLLYDALQGVAVTAGAGEFSLF